MNETIGQSIDDAIGSVTKPFKKAYNFVTRLKLQSPVTKGYSASDKEVITSQNLAYLRAVMNKTGRSNEWVEANEALKAYLYNRDAEIKIGTTKYPAYYKYVNIMLDAQLSLTDDLSAAYARTSSKKDASTSKYLGRYNKGDLKYHYVAIEGIQNRLIRLCDLVGDDGLKRQLQSQFKVSQELLRRAREESELHYEDEEEEVVEGPKKHKTITASPRRDSYGNVIYDYDAALDAVDRDIENYAKTRQRYKYG